MIRTTGPVKILYTPERIFTSKTNADFKRTKSSMYIDKWVLSLERSSDISNSGEFKKLQSKSTLSCEIIQIHILFHNGFYKETEVKI